MDVNPGSMLHESWALINMQFRMILISKDKDKVKSFKPQAASLKKIQPEVVYKLKKDLTMVHG